MTACGAMPAMCAASGCARLAIAFHSPRATTEGGSSIAERTSLI
jgi:hypothetical protein